MLRLVSLAVVICALVVGILPAANADAWVRWKDQTTKQYLDVVDVVNAEPSLEAYVWQIGTSFDYPGLLLNDASVDYHAISAYPQRLRIVGGGTGDWQEGDPSIPIYVRLAFKVKDTGPHDWREFHLRAISGCEIYSKYDTSNGLWYPAYWNYGGPGEYGEATSLGWDYVMDPTADPSWGSDFGPVYKGDTFSAVTWINVTSPTGDFEIEIWPTVPEPCTLLGLGFGLASLAARFVRRRVVR